MSSEKYIISTSNADKHSITKYNFKVMTQKDVLSDRKIREKYEKDAEYADGVAENKDQESDSSSLSQNIQMQQPFQPQPQPQQPIQQPISNEIIESLLSKSDKLAETLARLQSNMEKQSDDFEKRVAEQKQEAYERGLREGLEKAQNESEQRFNSIKEGFLDSINSLNSKILEIDTRYNNVEKELSSIAIDIAKEVIVSEVSKRGNEIALALSKVLIENLKEATTIKLKLNPQEMEFVKANLESDPRVKIESDKAISKGGVVIISDSGNIDGSVLSRYQNLKNSILESKKEDE